MVHEAVSPMAKTSGRPATVRSGPTTTRPARSDAAPNQRAAGDAWTPAAQTMVLAERGLPPYTTPSAEHSVTGVPSTTSTRSEEHTSELQSLMRISYAVFCLKKKTKLYNKEAAKTIRRETNTDTTQIKQHTQHD